MVQMNHLSPQIVDKDNAIITDIGNTGGNNKVGNQMFVATQTSYHMILRGGTGGGNFDTASSL